MVRASPSHVGSRWRDGAGDAAHAPLAEHDVVSLATPLALEDGRTLPRGARGAVVFIHDGGAAYVVEFVEPFHAVATLDAVDLSGDAAA